MLFTIEMCFVERLYKLASKNCFRVYRFTFWGIL